MKKKHRKLIYLTFFTGVLVLILFKTRFMGNTKKCRIVMENVNLNTSSTKEKEANEESLKLRKPIQLLDVPADIQKGVKPDEWISKTLTDSKRECPPLLHSEAATDVDGSVGCQLPNIDPFHPSIMNLLKDVPMPKCSQFKSYGKLVDGKIHFTDPTVVSAKYRRIVRNGDFRYAFGQTMPIPPLDTPKKITDEFIEVEYQLEGGKTLRDKEIFIQPVPHEHLLKRSAQVKPGIPLNILILGIDSMSHANAIRKLPRAYKYLKEELGSLIFNGHTIVGDGTTDQLSAMLTGLGEKEQYESRRNFRNARPVDGWPWIYKKYKESGYLTGYSGDSPYIGPFQLRLMGFDNPPTDFYPRPFYTVAGERLKDRTSNRCVASKTIAQVQFDYIRNVFATFKDKLKFFFSFNVMYSHATYSESGMIEPDVLSILKDIKQHGYLNNTLLIVMGDHGSRYDKARAVLQGKLEERLPLFTMTFPKWFRDKFPNIMNNLRINTNRLTSWFDVYATFRHMLSYPDFPSDVKHGQSLLTEVPISRTCKDANVADHWCPCLRWEPIDHSYTHVQNAALAAVEYMNNANLEYQESAEKCTKLSLKDVNYGLLERPNNKILSYSDTRDLKPIFDKRLKPVHTDLCHYQVQFTTSPNNGTYEATVRFHKSWFIVSKGISRINKYGDQPKCIERKLPHLRKYCMCKRYLPPTKLQHMVFKCV